ncbi:DUF1593 domain-containing protein [Microbacterium halotolerans]|uniref:DUF1593 domain-containing protein n=1 Tax=Microbacterium halotolerans TaxID=246613 RepID=UPI001F09751E|nr:DUF1593 domain-containing protein [Microbacterium halotolerans]
MSEFDAQAPPRVIVTTDPELDDLNSMLRLLLYSNEIDIAALVYSSSRFHFAGDEARGIAPHRWPAPGQKLHIDIAIDAYEKSHANLVRHDPRYPDPDALRGLVRVGNIRTEGDVQEPTDGSELVREALLGKAPGRVFAQAWGGTNTIARALMSIEEAYRDTAEWRDVHELITRRTVITSFAEQDSTFREYIRPHWPELEFRDVATTAWGYFAWDVVPDEASAYLSAEWMRENVTRVGPMGAEYRVWGDGKQLAAGFDDEDYFGLADASDDQLSARGYRVWAPVRPAGSWISEGDSSNFALHIDNGLRNAEHPTFGGWGGRQEPDPDDPHRWRSVGWSKMFDAPITDAGEVGQWYGAIQRDFAARLRWTVTSDFEDANHAPRVSSLGPTDRSVRPGDSVEFAFTAADPDDDSVRVIVRLDAQASTCRADVAATDAGCRVDVSSDARRGDTVSVIVEAIDDGDPPLTGYARFALTVT